MSAREPLSRTATVATVGAGQMQKAAHPQARGGTSNLMVRLSEIAALRLNSKPGHEGNEVVLRSGVSIPLTYLEAVALQECMRTWEHIHAGTERDAILLKDALVYAEA